MLPFIITDTTTEMKLAKKPNYNPTLNNQRESIIQDVVSNKLKIKEVNLLP
jgi:hypothetical protein